MKLLIAILALMCIGQGMAMTNNQTAYLTGMEDGWSICYMRLTNLTAYNEVIILYNAEIVANLNESEAAGRLLAPASNDYQLPEVFR